MKKKKDLQTNKRKCNYERRQITLDACHQQRVQDFKEAFEHLHGIQEELSSLHEQMSNVATSSHTSSKIDTLQAVLMEHSKTLDDEIEYYTNTANILYHYYESLENEHETPVTTTTHAKHHTKKLTTPPPQAKGKSILDFFSEQRPTNEEQPPPTAIVQYHEKVNKSELYDKYLHYTDVNFVKEKEEDISYYHCEHCNSAEQVLLLHEGMTICSSCHAISYVIVNNDKPSYKEPQKEISYLNYKRKNHFNEWLNQIQGKETTEIPEDVLNAILLDIKKLKITNMADLTHQKIREILKKLKLNKYYEHTPYIYYRITGIPNQYLSTELEDKLRNMFEQIQMPFLKHSPPTRKNFLSYSYCIHKMLQLLGEDKYLGYFPLLKNREKLHQQEQIWKKICEELGWMFIRSL